MAHALCSSACGPLNRLSHAEQDKAFFETDNREKKNSRVAVRVDL
jgi:hypothetical protein